MKRLKVSKAARADLREIYAYTFERWGERQADTYLGNLRTAMGAIAEDTAMVRPLVSRHKGIFQMHQGRHLIIFLRTAPDEVLVVRLLHDRMDIDVRLDE